MKYGKNRSKYIQQTVRPYYKEVRQVVKEVKQEEHKPLQMGFVDIITIIFVILKLLGLITWSWVWVLSPIWIAVLLIVFATLLNNLLKK